MLPFRGFFPGLRSPRWLHWRSLANHACGLVSASATQCRRLARRADASMTFASDSLDLRASPRVELAAFLGDTTMTAIMRRKAESFELPLAERTLRQLVQVFKLLADDSRLRRVPDDAARVSHRD